MDSDKANQLSDEFESKLSTLIPDIGGLTDQYQASGVIKIKLGNIFTGECEYIRGRPKCDLTSVPKCNSVPYEPSVSFSPESLSFVATSDPEITQQFWTEVASKLFESATFLGQSIEQTGEMFEVHFYINSATINSEQPLVCQWISDDILKCSNA